MNQWCQDAWQDFRYALRLFRGRPGFALLAVLTLSFGIGATTAVYTIVHAVLLRPLPYRNPDRLVVIWDSSKRDGDQVAQVLASPADFKEYTRSVRLMEDISFAGRTRPLLFSGGVTQRRMAGLVTTSLFSETLGVEAALGRTFTTADEKGGCSVVLANGFWISTLGADKSLIGRTLTLDKTPCTVLGVMPPGFTFFPDTADMWFLAGHNSAPSKLPSFGAIYARLNPGVTLDQARTEIKALHQTLNADNPADGDKQRDLTPAMDRIQSEFTFLAAPTLRKSLLLTFGAVSLLLLIACLNVANLLLARLSERHRELVVRAALGSGQMRLVRQVLAEGLLLALAGTALGVVIASASVSWFRHLNPVNLPPHAGQVAVNVPVLMFAVALSIITTLVFGLMPALQASGVDISETLKASGKGSLGLVSRRRTAQNIVTAQIAVSFVLLSGASLMLTSVLRLGSEALGFDPEGVVALEITLPTPSYSGSKERNGFQTALLEKVRNLPGVREAALGAFPPAGGNIGKERLEIQGHAPSKAPVFDVESAVAGSHLFEVLKTPLLRGRFFERWDGLGGPPVAIVSQKLVEEYFPGQDPVGQRIRVAEGDEQSPWMTIVGVVSTWKHLVNDATWRDTPLVFKPAEQQADGEGAFFSIGVRAAGNLGQVGREVQEQVAALDSAVEVKEPDLMSARLSRTLVYPRFRATLLVCFGLGALLLAIVGLHGVLAQLVTQRTAEFGVRRAVGARTSDLLLLVVRQGAIPVLAGIAVGLASSVALDRVISSMLYRIQPADPRSLLVVSATLIAGAAMAITLPAWRATRIDPAVALRNE